MPLISRQLTVEEVGVDCLLLGRVKKTNHDEDFILHEDKNLIIFTTKTNLSILKQSKHGFADGTFKINYQSNIYLILFWFSFMYVCPDNYY